MADGTVRIIGFDDSYKDREKYLVPLSKRKMCGDPVEVIHTANADNALKEIDEWDSKYDRPPDAVILDIMASVASEDMIRKKLNYDESPFDSDDGETKIGFSLCRHIRNKPNWDKVVVIFISSHIEKCDEERPNMELIALDFVEKGPGALDTLVTRLDTCIRYMRNCERQPITHGPLVIDPYLYQATYKEKMIPFTRKQLRTFIYLVQAAPRPVPGEELSAVFGIKHPVTYIAKLRRALRDHTAADHDDLGVIIENHTGAGYSFSPEELIGIVGE